tara:strand:- start:6404 stop:7309 length:906 start_codon:yes stop_codon:yes gene_type:complete
MKLLFENWRKFLKEAYPYADKDPQKVHDYLKATDAEKASWKRHPKARGEWETGGGLEDISAEEKAKLIQGDMMQSLQDHVSLTHQVYLDDHEAKVLLTYINEKNPILVLYSGTAYRGVRLSSFRELLPMLNNANFADLTGDKMPWFVEPIIKAAKISQRPGMGSQDKWATIKPPGNWNILKNDRIALDTNSFTKEWNRVTVFAAGVDKKSGASTGRDANPNLEVIFKSSGASHPFIDINKTLAKHGLKPEYPKDHEALSIGERPINEILIKIKPGVSMDELWKGGKFGAVPWQFRTKEEAA